jgi:exopolysaccharide biosynthesis polyprenyl glycosylphosphotransferase
MFAYRQKGLVTLHGALVIGFTAMLLPFYVLVFPHISSVVLVGDFNLLPYTLAVFFAMVASGGAIRREGSRLHILGISGAFSLASRQTLYVAGAVFAVGFALKDQAVSRFFLGSFVALNFFCLILIHRLLPSALAQLLFPVRNSLPCLFVGRNESLEDLDGWISSRGHIGIFPVGFLSNDPPLRTETATAPYLGEVGKLEAILKERNIAQVILLDWNFKDEEIENIAEICEQEGVRFLIHNNYAARFAREMIPIEEGGRHFLVMQTEPLEDPLNRAAKRLMDIAVALPVCLLVLPPLILVVATMQRLQAPGPIFFNRPRGGLNRRTFTMYKFRSMYVSSVDQTQQAKANDPRVFPFGRLMRKASLDEFPQFFNVLCGSMSLVGPRPHLPEHDNEFSQVARTYHGRSRVKPGITGLAQIRGYRGEVTEPHKLHRRVYWDLYYVSRWSMWVDVRILIITAWQIFFPPKSAY